MGMSNHREVVVCMRRAAILLKGMGAHSPSSRLGDISGRAAQLFSVLDSMLTVLPEDAGELALQEIERVVETLHMVDQDWPACGDAEALRLLDLAKLRLERLAQQFPDADG